MKDLQQTIRNLRKKIDEREDKLAEQLLALQEVCTHPDVVVKHRSNTGNYDKTADCYWDEYCCPDCRRQWSKDV